MCAHVWERVLALGGAPGNLVVVWVLALGGAPGNVVSVCVWVVFRVCVGVVSVCVWVVFSVCVCVVVFSVGVLRCSVWVPRTRESVTCFRWDMTFVIVWVPLQHLQHLQLFSIHAYYNCWLLGGMSVHFIFPGLERYIVYTAYMIIQ